MYVYTFGWVGLSILVGFVFDVFDDMTWHDMTTSAPIHDDEDQ